MRDPFLLMAQNNAWANGTLLRALAGMSDAEFAAPRPGFFPSLKATLNHVWKVDLYYLDALEQGGLGPRAFDEAETQTSVAGMARVQAAADARLIRFCAELAPGMLDAPRALQRRHGPVTDPVGMILLHLFQHQIHHRGQAHTMVGAAGIARPQLDDFYLEFGRVPSAQAYFV